jgi:RNA polymerase sigma-70 factor (ECF subfamily)
MQPISEGSTEPSDTLRLLVDHRHEFLGFLQRRLGSRELSEDILQEAFARSLGKVQQIEHEESAMAWFYRVLRNAITDYRRRRGVADRKLEELSRELSASPEPETQQAVCQCVKGLAASLKPEYAQALQAVELEGQAVKDFATTVGISPSNAGVRVFRAREALKVQLKRCCGSCADDNCRDCTCHAAPSPASDQSVNR